jgi:hypothetical protein
MEESGPDTRRNAVKVRNAIIEHVRNLKRTDSERNTHILNTVKASPAYKISNADCSAVGLFTNVNNPWQRTKRWLNEDYYVVLNNRTELFITILNASMMLFAIYIIAATYLNGGEAQIVPREGVEYNKKALDNLNQLYSGPMTILKIVGASIISIYGFWNIFKRTTHRCKIMNSAKVAVEI